MSTEDEMVGWHHQLKGHKFEQAQGDDEGQGSLMCYCLWDHKMLDTTEQHNKQQQILKYCKHIKKQNLLCRHYFASKGPSSQSYGFSNSHVWM